MIKNFKHKRLEQPFFKNNKKALDARDLAKITRILDRLDTGCGYKRYEYSKLGFA